MGYETFDRLCKDRGVTAYYVAKETGVSTATLSSWKTGRYTPKDEKLQKLADFFHVTTQYLRSGDDQEMNKRYTKFAEVLTERNEHRKALNITEEEWELIEAFRCLNKEGRKKALSNVIDFTWIEKYRKDKEEIGYIRTE